MTVFFKSIVRKKRIRPTPMMRPQPEDASDPCARIIAAFALKDQCVYCFRPTHRILMVGGRDGLERTRDHYVPRVHGGRKTIPCCRYCNGLKRDMMPADWWEFRRRNAHLWPRPHAPVRIKPIPMAESLMILREGKEAWSEWKRSQPAEYTNPKAQAAFEAAYRGREHLLRPR